MQKWQTKNVIKDKNELQKKGTEPENHLDGINTS